MKPTNAVSKREYAIRSEYSPKRTIYMHREIVCASRGVEVDHKDLDGLNNQKHNLRTATKAQNCRNRGKRDHQGGVPTTSRFKGVGMRRDTGRWRAFIRVRGLLIILGHFEDEIEAAKAYDRAARHHFGEFARLNEESWLPRII